MRTSDLVELLCLAYTKQARTSFASLVAYPTDSSSGPTIRLVPTRIFADRKYLKVTGDIKWPGM